MALYTKVEQSITFYNTTGVIEKHKNIYFVPDFSKAYEQHKISLNAQIRNAYLSLFNEKSQTFSDYSNINISSWSPEDRSLKVKGNIEDFRTVTSQGSSLNYFIIKRRCYTSETDYEDYYYGFFITNVAQIGHGSIEISYELDHFTNVYYLQNKDILTLDYINNKDPFNKVMKNTHIVRQHIDRVAFQTREEVDYVQGTVYDVGTSASGNYEYEGEIDILPSLLPKITKVELETPQEVEGLVLQVERENEAIYVWFEYTGGPGPQDLPIVLKIYYEEPELKALTNIEKFLNTEEAYTYRFEKRVQHQPINLLGANEVANLTLEEKEEIDRTNNFYALSDKIQKKIVLSSLAFLKIISKENITKYMVSDYSLPQGQHYYSVYERQYRGYIDNDKSIKSPFGYFLIPFINVPKQFERFDTILKNIQLKIISQFNIDTPTGKQAFNKELDISNSARRFLTAVTSQGYGNYIHSMQIVRYANIPETQITYYNNKIIFYPNTFERTSFDQEDREEAVVEGLDSVLPSGLNICFLSHKSQDFLDKDFKGRVEFIVTNGNLSIEEYDYNEQGIPTYLYQTKMIVGFVLSQPDHTDKTLKLQEVIPDLKTTYYEPILEGDPYNYYTISYLGGYEVPLKRLRYFTDVEYEGDNIIYNVKLTFIDNNNDLTKYSFIPVYEGIRYYNEAITVTLSNNIPITSDSYYNYYWQNQAQMKNQFAVNNFQRGTDLLKSTFVDLPAQAGSAGMFGGKEYAGAVGIRQVAGIVDAGISWAQSNQVIKMSQNAKMADAGNQPDTLKQTGSDVLYDLQTQETGLYLNKYEIDKVSYDNISKYLERFGYKLNIYDKIECYSRVGWNYVEIDHFDYEANITVPQEEAIREIFLKGVTLLHEPEVMSQGHNYEKILEKEV